MAQASFKEAGSQQPPCLFAQGEVCTSQSTAGRILRRLQETNTTGSLLTSVERRATTIPNMAEATAVPGQFVCRRTRGENGKCNMFDLRTVPVNTEDVDVEEPRVITVPVSRASE